MVCSSVNPHGISMMTSGSPSRARDQEICVEGLPSVPRMSRPPASRTISGTQWPGPRGYRLDPLPEYGHHGRPAASNAGRISHLLDARQYSAETRRLERQDVPPATEPPHSFLHQGVGDRAHVTELLRQNELRIESLEQVLIEHVEAAPLVQRGSNVPVNIPAVANLVAEDAPGHDGKPLRRLREVTFVRHADQLIIEAEREDDLGRAGKQRADLASHRWHAVTKVLAADRFEAKCTRT